MDLETSCNDVAVLRQGMVVMGHVATIVDSFRRLFLIEEMRVWLLVTWMEHAGGSRRTITPGLLRPNCRMVTSPGTGTAEEQDFDAEWLSGQDPRSSLEGLRIHEEVEAFM